jgi:outer membrane protein assembly factor BamB
MAQGEDRIGLLATVGVLLLALLTVCVVWFTRADAALETEATTEELTASPSATAPPLAEVWQAPDAAGQLTGEDTVTRLWPGDSVVTRVSATDVTGYGTLDGQPVWQAEVPEGAETPCAASQSTNSAGLGAVLYRLPAHPPAADSAAASCSMLAVYDTESGALLWSDELPAPADPGSSVPAVTVGERAVTVNLDEAGSVAGFHRFEAETGEALPLPEPPTDGWCAAAEPLAVRHAGSRIVMLSECPAEQSGEAASRALSVYGADTGALEWTHLSDDPDFGFTGILAGNPVLIFQGEDADRQLVAFSETGEELWRRSVGAAGELPGLLPDESAVVGDVLVSRYEPEDGTAGYAVAGYDLSTRERVWARDLPEGSRLLGVDVAGTPLLSRQDGDRLELLRLDPTTGVETPEGSVGPLIPSLVAFDDHQLYVLNESGTADSPLLRLHAFAR